MTADFEFIVEESFIIPGGVRVTGQLGRGRLAGGEAGWLQVRPDLAIAVGRIEVERQPQAGLGRAVLVLRAAGSSSTSSTVAIPRHYAAGTTRRDLSSWPGTDSTQPGRADISAQNSYSDSSRGPACRTPEPRRTSRTRTYRLSTLGSWSCGAAGFGHGDQDVLFEVGPGAVMACSSPPGPAVGCWYRPQDAGQARASRRRNGRRTGRHGRPCRPARWLTALRQAGRVRQALTGWNLTAMTSDAGPGRRPDRPWAGRMLASRWDHPCWLKSSGGCRAKACNRVRACGSGHRDRPGDDGG